MADGADAADTSHQRWHLVQGAALGDALKAPHLGHMEMGVGDLPGVVQEDGDLGVALDPGNRFNYDLAHFFSQLNRNGPGRRRRAIARRASPG